MKLTAVFQKVPEGYIGFVEEVPGANAQGESLEEVRANLSEAVSLILDANRLIAEQSIEGKEDLQRPGSSAGLNRGAFQGRLG